MSFCWTRHRISLTNAEVAHNASLLLDKVTFHSSNAFLRSVFRSARLNTQKKKTWKILPFFSFSFFFWESLHVCWPGENASREASSFESQREALRNFTKGWCSFSLFYFVSSVEFGVFGGTLASDVTRAAPPPPSSVP